VLEKVPFDTIGLREFGEIKVERLQDEEFEDESEEEEDEIEENKGEEGTNSTTKKKKRKNKKRWLIFPINASSHSIDSIRGRGGQEFKQKKKGRRRKGQEVGRINLFYF